MRQQFVRIDLIGIPIDAGPEPEDHLKRDSPQTAPDHTITENINQSSSPRRGSSIVLASDSYANWQGQLNYRDSPRPVTPVPVFESQHCREDPPLDFKSHLTVASPSDSPDLINESTINRPYDSPRVTPIKSPASPLSDDIQRSRLKKFDWKSSKKKQQSTTNSSSEPMGVTPGKFSSNPKSTEILRSCLKKLGNKGNKENANVTFTTHNRVKYYRSSTKLTSSRSCLSESVVEMREEFLGWRHRLVRDNNLMVALDIEPGEIIDKIDVHPRRLVKLASAMASRTLNTRQNRERIANGDYEASDPPPKLHVATTSKGSDHHLENNSQTDIRREPFACNVKATDSGITNKTCLRVQQPASLGDFDSKCLASSTDNVAKEEYQACLDNGSDGSELSEAESAVPHVDDKNPRHCPEGNLEGSTVGGKSNGYEKSLEQRMEPGGVDGVQWVSYSKELLSPFGNTRKGIVDPLHILPSTPLDHWESEEAVKAEGLCERKDYSVTLPKSHYGYTERETGVTNALPIPAQCINHRDITPLGRKELEKHIEEDNRSLSSLDSAELERNHVFVANGPSPILSSICSRRCISCLETTYLKESLHVTGASGSHLRPTRSGLRVNKNKLNKSTASENRDTDQKSDKRKLPLQRSTSDVSGRRKSRGIRSERGNTLSTQSLDQRETKIPLIKKEQGVHLNKENGIRISSSESGKCRENKVFGANGPVTTRLQQSPSAIPKLHPGNTKDDDRTRDLPSTINTISMEHCSSEKSGKQKLLGQQTACYVSDRKKFRENQSRCRNEDFIQSQPAANSESGKEAGKQNVSNGHRAKACGKQPREKTKDEILSSLYDHTFKKGEKEHIDGKTGAINWRVTKTSKHQRMKRRGQELKDGNFIAINGHRAKTTGKQGREEPKNNTLSAVNGHQFQTCGKQRRGQTGGDKTSEKETKDDKLCVVIGQRDKTSRKQTGNDKSNAVNGNATKTNRKECRKQAKDEQISAVTEQSAINMMGSNQDSSGDEPEASGKEKTKGGNIIGNAVKKAWEHRISGETDVGITLSKPCSSATVQGCTITREAVRNRFRAREYTNGCEKDDVKAVRKVARMLNSGKDPCSRRANQKNISPNGRGIQSKDVPNPSVGKTGAQTTQKRKPGKIRRLMATICEIVRNIGKRQRQTPVCQTEKPMPVGIIQSADILPRSCLKRHTHEHTCTEDKPNVKFAVQNTVRFYNTSQRIPSTKSCLGEGLVKMKETCGGGHVRRVAEKRACHGKRQKQRDS